MEYLLTSHVNLLCTEQVALHVCEQVLELYLYVYSLLCRANWVGVGGTVQSTGAWSC